MYSRIVVAWNEQVRALKVSRVPLEIIGGRDRQSKSLTRVGQRSGVEEWRESVVTVGWSAVDQQRSPSNMIDDDKAWSVGLQVTELNYGEDMGPEQGWRPIC